MRVVEVDQTGAIRRRLDFDPERRSLIEMMFRMALRGKPAAAIARAANKAGWRTKPQTTSAGPHAWSIDRVLCILRNPRYAGLSATKGEVLGRGQWPAYITELQHHRLRARLARPRWTKQPRQLEPYLLARLARCGYCGSSMALPHGT